MKALLFRLPNISRFYYSLLFFGLFSLTLLAEDAPAAGGAAPAVASPAAPEKKEETAESAEDGATDDEGKPKKKDRKQKNTENRLQPKPVTFYLNLQDYLKVDFEIGNVVVANPDIIEVKQTTEPDEMQITPKQKGRTSITIFDSKNRRRAIFYAEVADEELGIKKKELMEMVGPMEGAEIKIIGGAIIIDGEFYLPKDLRRLFRVLNLARYKSVVFILASISPLTLELLARRMEKEINNPDISLKVLNGRIVVTGIVDSNDQKEEIKRVINAYLPPVYVPNPGDDQFGKFSYPPEHPETGAPPILFRVKVAAKANPLAKAEIAKFTVQFVSMTRTFARQFEFSWSPVIVDQAGGAPAQTSPGGTATPPPSGGSQFQFDLGSGNIFMNIVGTIASLFPRLQSGEQHGHAKVLRSATVLIPLVEGEAAQSSIVDGPEITIPNASGNPTKVNLQNKITIDKVRRIPNTNRLTFNYSIAFASGGASGGQAVNSQSTSIGGTLVLAHMESAALGGVLNQDNSADFNTPSQGAPSSGSPLFNFNRSRNIRNDKSQTIIFITPAILKRASDGIAALKRKYRLRREGTGN